MDDLFRREALSRAAVAESGSICIAVPIGASLWAIGALGVTAAVSVFIGVGSYTHRQHATGMLVPDAGTIAMAAMVSGHLDRVLVREGQSVHRGDLLAILSSDRISERLGGTASVVGAALDMQAKALRADIDSTDRLTVAQIDDFRMQEAMLTRQLGAVRAEAATASRQVADITALLNRWEPLLAHGYVSTLDIQSQKNQLMSAETQVHALEKQELETAQQLATARDQLAQLPLTSATKIRDLRRQLGQEQQALAQSEADRATVLRAESDGVIGAILASPGQSVAAGQNIIALIPAGSVMRARLMVPSSAIGFVHPGTSVILSVTAFPYQKFGLQRGTVTAVSRTVLTPAELSQIMGEAPGKEPLYRVEVTLPVQHIVVFGKKEALRPGMAVEADLMLERRSLLEWMFEPFLGMSRRLGDGT